MAGIRLGVRRQGQPKIFILLLARIPLLLFRHAGGIRLEKGQTVESIAEYEIIRSARLTFVHQLAGLAETLQGQEVVRTILVGDSSIRSRPLPGVDLLSFFILPQ